MARDPYEILGVSRGDDEAAVKKRFRRVARELHPDVNSDDPSAEARFKEAAQAYEILSDPEKRATYDRYGHEGLRSGGYASSFDSFDSFGSFGDIFDAFFGGGGGGGGAGRRSGPVRGDDLLARAEIGLAEAATGAAVDVAFEAVARCEICHGNGAEPGTPIGTCPRCEGEGQIRAVSRTPFGQVVRAAVCDRCGGDGRVPERPCPTCSGRGLVVEQRSVRVDVPAGIADGQRIRVSGRGHAGERGGPAGDLYVGVAVREDTRFVRDGDDLVTVADVPAPLAALGGALRVPTLEGDEELDLPAGSQPGDVIPLRARGMPAVRSGRRGNLRVVLNVVIPRRLTSSQRALLKELADSLTDENLSGGDDDGVLSKLRRVLRV